MMAEAKKGYLIYASFSYFEQTNSELFHKRTDLCALCCENVCWSVKRNFETRHKKNFKDKAIKAE